MMIYMYEIKKMLFHQRGLWFLLAYLLLATGFAFLTCGPANEAMELYADQYDHYLSIVEGPLTDAKEAFLQSEAKALSQADIAVQKLYADFYEGNMTREDLETQAAPYEALLNNRRGFDLIFEQYMYVRENPENRYFTRTNGWNALLDDERPDFLLVFVLLLLAAPFFIQETASGMDRLLLTGVHGGISTARGKINLMLGTTVLLCLFTSMVRYGICRIRYGLPNGSFPMQSLSCFSSSEKTLTLFMAFILMTALRTLGYLLLSMAVMVVSAHTKKYALTLLLCSAGVLLPYAGIGTGTVAYYGAFPLNFMLAAGFLKGDQVQAALYGDTPEVVFTEIPPTHGLCLVIIAAVLGLMMYLSVLRRYTNVWHSRRRPRPALLILLCLLTLGASGCAGGGSHDDIYNMSSKGYFKNDRYEFQSGYTDDSTDLTFTDRATGETASLVRSPLKSMWEISDAIYGNGACVYYLRYDIDRSGQKPRIDHMSIIEVDTEDFSEKIIFEKNIRETQSRIFGIATVQATDLDYLNPYAFFLDARHVYLINGDEILRIDRRTGRTGHIPVNGQGNKAFDGRYLYYINEHYEIVKYDTQNDCEQIFTHVIARDFYLTDGGLLYENRQDQNKIYGLDTGSGRTWRVPELTELPVETGGGA